MKNKKYKVLLIEDDVVDRMAFQRFAKDGNFPYDYTVAGSVSEAFKILGTEKFDAIITDFSIGDGSAFDILALVKDTPSIVVTGTGNEELAVKVMKAGAFDYLVKDVESNHLKVLSFAVEKTIQRSNATKELKMLSLAIKNVKDSVFITDTNNIIGFVNDAFCDTYGYTEEEIIGRKGTILGSIAKEGEITHKKKDGGLFPVVLTMSVLKNEDGKDVAIVRVAHNILKRKEMEDELKRLATTDRLTQAYNRLKFEEIIGREKERARRYNQPLSMIMFDIDDFKKLNDTYGHLAGDKALRAIADIVRENVRKIEYLIRWGGEEFMIIAVGAELEKAAALAERIREIIAAHKFEDAGHVTLSFGVTEFRKDDSEDLFIKRADEALYRAKIKGKNRVEISA